MVKDHLAANQQKKEEEPAPFDPLLPCAAAKDCRGIVHPWIGLTKDSANGEREVARDATLDIGRSGLSAPLAFSPHSPFSVLSLFLFILFNVLRGK